MPLGSDPPDFRRACAGVTLVVAAICMVVAAGVAVPARAAPAVYPPVPPKPPRAHCSISTIVNRHIAILCNAGKARARQRAAIKIGTKIVAHGVVGRNGLYLARFTLRKRLVRGTRIQFLVAGKVVTTIRV
jgi:hypothetical protein